MRFVSGWFQEGLSEGPLARQSRADKLGGWSPCSSASTRRSVLVEGPPVMAAVGLRSGPPRSRAVPPEPNGIPRYTRAGTFPGWFDGFLCASVIGLSYAMFDRNLERFRGLLWAAEPAGVRRAPARAKYSSVADRQDLRSGPPRFRVVPPGFSGTRASGQLELLKQRIHEAPVLVGRSWLP